ncbi:MAG: alpha/beta fold hydrolase [Verrucomicrobiota bacterium]
MDIEIPAPVRHPFPLKRMLIRLGIWLVLAAGILFGVMVWWCASEIAEPGRRSLNPASQEFFEETSLAGFTVESFESSGGMPCLVCTPKSMAAFSKKGETIRGQLLEKKMTLAPSGEIIGTLLILHGRTGMKEDYLAVAERFCAVGFRCIIPDLPGHGSNKQRFTTYGVLEAPMVLKCYEEAAAKYGFAQEPCMILGQSMGGAYAVQVAALDESPFQAMVVVSSFDKLQTVVTGETSELLGDVVGAAVSGSVEHVYAWKTGVKISDINTAEKAPMIHIPTLVIHGASDQTIPVASGEKLYHSFPSDLEKQWLVVPQAGHNNILITDYPLYATMAEWFLKYLKAG